MPSGGAVVLLAAALATAGPYRDVTAASGIDFRHFDGFTGQRYDPEVMGAGVALFDHDGDGDVDVLLLDGDVLPGTPPPPRMPRARLFSNDGRGRFEDATDRSGLGHRGFAMGAAVGDVDADGAPDVLITAYGPDALYLNRGGGRFERVDAGVEDERWTTSAAFLDYDRDGDLDLYVAAYLDFAPERDRPCLLRGHETYCGPQAYAGLSDRLYRNDGSGRFADVSREAGVGGLLGKGLGVVAGDWDADGDTDLYVANDRTPNFLLLNRADEGVAGFVERGLLHGVALGESARPEAGMGTDMGDVDGDGWPDLVCTNLWGETNALYRNLAGRGGVESSYAVGLGAASFPWVGFGVRFVDYDSDGDLDLAVANGHIIDNVAEIQQGATFAQDDQLFENVDGSFREACRPCWPRGVGRGLASGDLDDDGDADLLVTNNGGAPFVLANVALRRGDVAGLALEGRSPGSPRDAYGAVVSWRAGDVRRAREVRSAASYLSASDPRLLLAVPHGTGDVAVEIRWPSGVVEHVALATGAYHRVVEGEGLVSSRGFRAAAP